MTRRVNESTLDGGNVTSLLRRMAWLVSYGATTMPALKWFAEYLPPYWPMGIYSLAAVALACVALASRVKSTVDSSRPLNWSVAMLCLTILACIGYRVLFEYTTVTPPQFRSDAQRIQIGFGLQSWSLTPKAQAALQRKHAHIDPDREPAIPEIQSPADLVQFFGIWAGSPVTSAWQPWSVILSGVLTTALLVLALGFWCAGLAFLVRVYSKKS